MVDENTHVTILCSVNRECLVQKWIFELNSAGIARTSYEAMW